MKYSFWDKLFNRVSLKIRILSLATRIKKLEEENEGLKLKCTQLIYESELRAEQLVQSIDVAKMWKNKHDTLSQKIQKDKEDLKNFLSENIVTK